MAWHGPQMHGSDEDENLGKAYDGRLMRRLLPYLKQYRKIIAIALVILLASSAMDLAGPFLTKIAIDRYIAPQNGPAHMGGLPTILALYLGSLAIGFFLRYTMNYLLQWVGQHIMYDMRTQIFNHLQHLNLQFF